jgi:F0F1-type ATP synthase membrane subunit b/b'
MKTVFSTASVVLLLATGAFAQKPAQNVSPNRHPNLAAAQKFSTDAYEKIVAAQKANEWDMKGHAQKAKELLEQVNNELKQAAQAANEKAK